MVLCRSIAVCLVPYFYQLALPATCNPHLQASNLPPSGACSSHSCNPCTPPHTQHTSQVSNPSSERRTLIAQLLGSLSSRVDLGTQAHVLLTQLHRLAEDRIDQVGHFWV